MSEAEFIVFENISVVLETLVYAGSLAYFFYPFMTEKKEPRRSKQKKIFIVFATYSLIYFADMIFHMRNWLCMTLVLVILAAATKYLDMDKKGYFLLMIFFVCIKCIGRLMAESLYYVLIKKWVWEKTRIEIIYRNNAIVYSIYMMTVWIIFIFMIYFLKKRISVSKLELQIREICHLGLIPVIGVLFVSVIYRFFSLGWENGFFHIYEKYPLLLGVIPSIAILFYVGILITILSYQKMIALQEEKKKYFVEEQQLHALQERTREVEQFYKGIRQMKHEMRNHLTNIKGLAESGKYEELEKYIAQMDGELSAYELTVKTGNAVTDVIVGDKKNAAGMLGIDFQTEFIYPQSNKYNAYDVGIILNNLLTNALEACEKIDEKEERYIILSGRQKRKFFLIEVKNSFQGEIEFDTNTELPVSTKQIDISLHGLGLSNVKREVEKYMGDMKIKVRKNEFSVTVLLQERSNENGNKYNIWQ
ncbi:MAG: GHKL domain-containing protein [Lachnospiraceae bacterium]|nr:GHKL domain-containing protein [Lachnospiraceae bacterium]